MATVKEKFRAAIDAKFGPVFGSYVYNQVELSLTSNQGKFIVTDAKNIRVTANGKLRRVTAQLTLKVAPGREVKARYLLTYDAKRIGREYRAEIKEIK
jgi:hypothetical protein